MTTIYLVRHGKTDWLGNRITGNIKGVHLNEIGRSQAARIAAYLAQFSIKAVFSSPMERTMETAEPLAAVKGLSISSLDFLREIDFGTLQGLGEELASLPIWHQFLSHPAEVLFPDGESVNEAQQRIVAGLKTLAAKYPGDAQIVCFGHCEILRLAVAHVLNMPLDDYMRLTISPASISCVEWKGEDLYLKLLNFVP
jgi:probable phosphoglycerate mutase